MYAYTTKQHFAKCILNITSLLKMIFCNIKQTQGCQVVRMCSTVSHSCDCALWLLPLEFCGNGYLFNVIL